MPWNFLSIPRIDELSLDPLCLTNTGAAFNSNIDAELRSEDGAAPKNAATALGLYQPRDWLRHYFYNDPVQMRPALEKGLFAAFTLYRKGYGVQACIVTVAVPAGVEIPAAEVIASLIVSAVWPLLAKLRIMEECGIAAVADECEFESAAAALKAAFELASACPTPLLLALLHAAKSTLRRLLRHRRSAKRPLLLCNYAANQTAAELVVIEEIEDISLDFTADVGGEVDTLQASLPAFAHEETGTERADNTSDSGESTISSLSVAAAVFRPSSTPTATATATATSTAAGSSSDHGSPTSTSSAASRVSGTRAPPRVIERFPALSSGARSQLVYQSPGPLPNWTWNLDGRMITNTSWGLARYNRATESMYIDQCKFLTSKVGFCNKKLSSGPERLTPIEVHSIIHASIVIGQVNQVLQTHKMAMNSYNLKSAFKLLLDKVLKAFTFLEGASAQPLGSSLAAYVGNDTELAAIILNSLSFLSEAGKHGAYLPTTGDWVVSNSSGLRLTREAPATAADEKVLKEVRFRRNNYNNNGRRSTNIGYQNQENRSGNVWSYY